MLHGSGHQLRRPLQRPAVTPQPGQLAPRCHPHAPGRRGARCRCRGRGAPPWPMAAPAASAPDGRRPPRHTPPTTHTDHCLLFVCDTDATTPTSTSVRLRPTPPRTSSRADTEEFEHHARVHRGPADLHHFVIRIFTTSLFPPALRNRTRCRPRPARRRHCRNTCLPPMTRASPQATRPCRSRTSPTGEAPSPSSSLR